MAPPPTANQTERGADTRRRILEAASDLFLERGYSQTPISAILTASGVTKGGFYFHFPSKAALGTEVARAACQTQQTMAIELIDPELPAFDQLIAMPQAVAASHVELPPMVLLGRLCVQLREEPDAEPVDPYAFWFDVVTDLVRRAQAEGDIDPAIDPARAAYHLVTAYVGMEYVDTIRGAVAHPNPHIDEFLEFALRGIGVEAPARRIPDEPQSDPMKGDE